MEDLGISNRFLANRIYPALGYDSPNKAEAFISQIRRGTAFSKHFMQKDTEGCAERKRVFYRRIEIIQYALGFSPEKVEYREYPPENGVLNETITSFLDALKNPSKAKLEILLQLEPDEKLSILSDKGYQNVMEAINNQIQQRRVKRKI